MDREPGHEPDGAPHHPLGRERECEREEIARDRRHASDDGSEHECQQQRGPRTMRDGQAAMTEERRRRQHRRHADEHQEEAFAVRDAERGEGVHHCANALRLLKSRTV